MKTLGQKIRELRGKANQKTFAEEFGYTLRQISAWERGESEPPSDFYTKIANRFGSNYLQFLLSDTETMPVQSPVNPHQVKGELSATLNAILYPGGDYWQMREKLLRHVSVYLDQMLLTDRQSAKVDREEIIQLVNVWDDFCERFRPEVTKALKNFGRANATGKK